MSINQSLSFRRSSNSKLVTSHKKQNVVRANSQLLKKQPLFYQDSSEALKSVYLAEQQNPIKSKQRSKSKKKLKKQNPTPVYQNSNRRKNDINCEQILNLLKKRETHSALDNNHQIPSSSISTSNLSKVKPKMKKKKKTPIYVLPRMQAPYQVSNILKNGQLLSQSSSFIVFSDKQSASLNNTLLRSKIPHYKKTQIKPQKAAILIQKIWRGYMTRKLLQQYIKDQEPKIMEALKSLNSSSAKQSITSSIFLSSFQQKNCQKLKQLFNYLNQDDDKLNEDNNQNKQIPQKAQLQDISSIIEDTIKNVGFVDYNHQLLNSFQNSALVAFKELDPQTPQSSHNDKKTNNNCLFLEQDKAEQGIRTNSAKGLPFPNKSSTLKQLSHPHQLPHENQCASKAKQKLNKLNKVNLVLSMPQSLQITVKPQSKRSSLNVSEFFYSQQSNLQFIINNKIQNLIQKHKKFINQLLQENELTLPIYLQRVKMLKSVKQACFQGSKKFCMQIQRVLADLKASSFYDTQEEQQAISQQRQESQSSQNDTISNVREINQSLRKPSSEIFNLQSVQPLKIDKDINSLRFQNKENQQIFSNHQINNSVEQIDQTSQTTFGNHQIVEMLKSSKPNSIRLQSNSKIEKNQNKVSYHVGIQQIKMYTQNIYNQIQQCKQSVTELEFLCQLLRRHSENGAQNMIERCLIQFLVELITSQYPIESVLSQILSIIKGNNKEKIDAKDIVYSKDRQLRQIILRWAKQLSKWDLGTIQQVSHVMESSSFLTQGNQNQHMS